ncbi:MAG: T9SS type A sorting domain-containing protein [Bacteroidota bacterium]|nr:T9SS type A sorting domain-containing protein [Bacteroidota bacterium]
MKRILSTFFLFLFISPFALCQVHPVEILKGNLTGISEQLRNLPTSSKGKIKEKEEDERINKRVKFNVDNANAKSADGALQRIQSISGIQKTTSTSPEITFNGNSQADNNALGLAVVPPDPVMAAGPNNVVQMINLCHSVFDKSGTRISGPVKFSSIAPGATDNGDPIVIYDNLADRWVLMQFSDVLTGDDKLIICVSKTNDPAGAYYIYTFPFTNILPDYPHIAVWNNSYVITTHEFNSPSGSGYVGQGFYAVDRAKMLAGFPTSTLIRFSVSNDGGNLPASIEGMKTPEPNSPTMFFTWDSDETGAATDRLQVRTMNVDFDNPASSTLSSPVILNTSAFDGRSPSVAGAIEQSGSSNDLDAIADRMMSRVVYRRFDNYESVVMNYTVNISGVNPTKDSTYQSAIRWYELRRSTPASPWTIYQQSTYAPDVIDPVNGFNNWMGSIDINQKGNIGIAYSRSGKTGFPDLYYAIRKNTDALSTMEPQQVFYASEGSQTSSSHRWGDYSSMNIDPADDESFWFTGEYYPSTTSTGFRTRIGKFLITDTSATPTVHFKFGGTIARLSEITNLTSGSSCITYKDYPITLVVDQAPSQPATISLSASGTATQGVDYDLIYASPLTLSAGNLSQQITLRVYDAAQSEPDKFIDLSYSINANGGNAVAAAYNQKNRITIIGKAAIDPLNFVTPVYGTPTTIFSDNFDTVTTSLGAWKEQVINTATGNVNHFKVGTNAGNGFSNQALYISNNDDTIKYSNTASGTLILRAVSPIINATGKEKISVSFKYKCLGETPAVDYGSLYYSTDGGTTWTEADPNNKLISNTTVVTKTINLPPDADNASNLQIAFQWKNDNSTQNQPPLGVDSVVVNGTPVFYNSAIQTAINTSTIGTFSLGPSQTVSFIDTASNKIMATIINNSSFNFGCTKVEVDRAGTSAVNFNTTNASERVASKTFKITPQFNNPTASYTLRLYYTEAEIAGWEAATGLNRSQIQLVKVDGNNRIQDVTPANQTSYSYSINSTTPSSLGSDGIIYEHTFASNSLLAGLGIGTPPTLLAVPITLLEFSGIYQKNKGNLLSWKVTNQLNVNLYELESSTDGIHFKGTGTVTPINTNNGDISYDYLDQNYVQGDNFYRLKTSYNNGTFEYSSIVLINVNDNGNSIIIYPNPVNDILFLNYKGTSKDIKIQVIDATGRTVYMSKTIVNNPLKIPVHNLSPGEYILRVYDATGVYSTKFIR